MHLENNPTCCQSNHQEVCHLEKDISVFVLLHLPGYCNINGVDYYKRGYYELFVAGDCDQYHWRVSDC